MGMTTPFREATRVTRVGDGGFEASIPDGWQQGRGAFGGLVLGLLVRAAGESEPEAVRGLRSLSADIAGPVMPGPARIEVRVLRRGRSQTNLQLSLSQEGEVLASGLCTLGAARSASVDPRAPAAPEAAHRDWTSVPVVAIAPPFGPVFARHYEYRNLGPMPFCGAKEAATAGFVREREAEGELDAAAITALLDAWYPALFNVSVGPMRSTTVSFSSQYMHHGRTLPAGAPLFFRAHTVTQREGYFIEFRELWCQDELVALNQQTFAVLG